MNEIVRHIGILRVVILSRAIVVRDLHSLDQAMQWTHDGVAELAKKLLSIYETKSPRIVQHSRSRRLVGQVFRRSTAAR
jgi:hypothetical protein